MMQITGRITTMHKNAHCVAPALTPDNLTSMTTTADGDCVTMTITGTQIRSVIASVDDYLMNLAVAEDTCSSFSHMPEDLNSKNTCQITGPRHGEKTGSKKDTRRRSSR